MRGEVGYLDQPEMPNEVVITPFINPFKSLSGRAQYILYILRLSLHCIGIRGKILCLH